MYKILFVGVYIIIEYFLTYNITKKYIDNTKETINMFKSDFWTSQYFVVFFTAILISLIYYFFYTNYMLFENLDLLWCILIIFSGVIEYRAIKELKENYYPQVGPEKRIIKTGIYKYIRHPIYLSAMILGTSLILLFSFKLTIYLLPILLLSIIFKIETEDKYLLNKYKEYKIYSKNSKKIIPLVY